MVICFVSECKDQYTGAKYHAGDRIEFPEKRAEEILATGYAIAIEEEIKEEKEEIKTTKKPTRTRKKATK